MKYILTAGRGLEESKRFDPRGPYTQGELRGEVDEIAAGRPWGWRNGGACMEAVCDFRVIAEAWEQS